MSDSESPEIPPDSVPSEPDPNVTMSNQAIFLSFVMVAYAAGFVGVIGAIAGEIVAIWWLVPGTVVLAVALALALPLIIYSSVGLGYSEENSRDLGSVDERQEFFFIAILFFVIASAVIVATFSELSRHVYMAFHGFSAADSGVFTWVRFSLQEWVDAATLGIASIYGHISSVEATSWWSKTFLVLLYHLLCTLVIISSVKKGIDRYRSAGK